jgi:hypothetical protein
LSSNPDHGKVYTLQDYVIRLSDLRQVGGFLCALKKNRVKNHDFTPKNHIFSNCGGRSENVLGISCEKSRFYAKKTYFFHIVQLPYGQNHDGPQVYTLQDYVIRLSDLRQVGGFLCVLLFPPSIKLIATI